MLCSKRLLARNGRTFSKIHCKLGTAQSRLDIFAVLSQQLTNKSLTNKLKPSETQKDLNMTAEKTMIFSSGDRLDCEAKVCDAGVESAFSVPKRSFDHSNNKKIKELDLEDKHHFQLTRDTVNENVLKAEYAVRGPVLERALEIEQKLKEDPNSYPFDKVVQCNIGNPQALSQKPITFTRQVLSLVMNPDMLGDESIAHAFPRDARERAKSYLDCIKSVGAYSESSGMDVVRREVATFIRSRDSVPVDEHDIFLTAGASDGVERMMRILLRSDKDAVLVPVPQYPLYSALTTAFNGHFAPYYISEEAGWELDMVGVRESLKRARQLGKNVRAMVVINPGNPTGSVLSNNSMEEIVKFCIEEKIVLMADEVYQQNVYTADKEFVSFRKIARDLGVISSAGKLLEPLQLVSFHSSSKGVVGECGLRSGYLDLLGFSKEVKKEVYKLASIKLCSNVPGQIAMGLMVNPPCVGDESYSKFKAEVDDIFNSLKRRSKKLQNTLNTLDGIHCNDIEGAMYAFPKIELPERFINKARQQGDSPETLYAIETLEQTGLVIVPGSGFGQAEGTYHFRTTFLPPDDEFDEVLQRFSQFHSRFMHENS
mmetsp:Transcript_3987/g.4880  ORF Transcript_3987/g.4880 Transcript_3987/m.4880 type:complete len:597 (-) Transcript_3987:17-1807(-)